MPDHPEPKTDLPEPVNLRFLRRLVTTLTATMIVGVIAIFTILVIRLQSPTVTFPDNLALPVGAQVQALTRSADYLIAVTDDGRIFVLSPDGQAVQQVIELH